jgi:hypothetical protein
MDSLNLERYQFVFVGGILGEMLKLNFVASYFEDSKNILKALGAQETYIFQPNSLFTAEENSQAFVSYLNQLFKTNQKKIVLICHSKGCLEALASLVHYPAIMERIVQKVFCVQPPFKGSALTEFYSQTYKVSSKLWPGLRSLGRDAVQAMLKEIPAAQKKMIEHKMIIVKGAKPEKIAWILKVSHKKLAKRGVVSDGLLSLDDQELEGYNLSQLTIPMDHSDLFTSKVITRASMQFKTQVLSNLMLLV